MLSLYAKQSRSGGKRGDARLCRYLVMVRAAHGPKEVCMFASEVCSLETHMLWHVLIQCSAPYRVATARGLLGRNDQTHPQVDQKIYILFQTTNQ